MRIHKEGTLTILIAGIFLLLLNLLLDEFLFTGRIPDVVFAGLSLAFFLFILSFFRNPKRKAIAKEGEVISPCDGKVVAIETTEEPEFFHSKRIQVSIFMS